MNKYFLILITAIFLINPALANTPDDVKLILDNENKDVVLDDLYSADSPFFEGNTGAFEPLIEETEPENTILLENKQDTTNEKQPELIELQVEKVQGEPEELTRGQRYWKAFKGKQLYNSVLLGMFSHHTSDTHYNETQNLIGLDYNGYCLGTFRNSYDHQTTYFGIGRELYRKKLSKNITFDAKYKAVVMHGYREKYPDLLGLTPIIMPMFGFSWGNSGFDFIAIPNDEPIFTINFRYNLPHKLI